MGVAAHARCFASLADMDVETSSPAEWRRIAELLERHADSLSGKMGCQTPDSSVSGGVRQCS
jgi:hypothetical protein